MSSAAEMAAMAAAETEIKSEVGIKLEMVDN